MIPAARSRGHGQVPYVRSTERHYFGFHIRPLLDVLRRTRWCDERDCGERPVAIIEWGYVTERSHRPTYVSEVACPQHAGHFCRAWGLERDDRGWAE